MSGSESVTDFFIRLNAGSESAAEETDRRYRQRLCALVEREMGKRFFPREDPEDVVQSALRSFFRGIDEGRFRIDQSGKLWALLEKISIHKMLKHIEYHEAKMRTPGKEDAAGDQRLSSREPRPEDAAHVADLIEQVVEGLEPPDPEIFRLRLAGCTRDEIADRVGRTAGSVRCTLDRIRARLKRLVNDGADR